MKSLSKDIKVIAAALETSTELVVSGHRVRRKEPLPQVDETEVLLRTAIVDNLPDQATIGAYILEAYQQGVSFSIASRRCSCMQLLCSTTC